jgi:predicted nucleic acid-binding protein
MAGTATYTVVLDANVLYPISVIDLILSLAGTNLFHARWSDDIETEAARNLAEKRPALADKIPGRFEAMRRAIPDCIIGHFDHIIESLQLPDPDDRHVLAAAIVGHADAIVTFNLKDFPVNYVSQFGIEVLHPDDFVMNQIDLNQVACLGAIKAMRAGWNSPAYTAKQLADFYSRIGLTQTSDFLRSAIKLI